MKVVSAEAHKDVLYRERKKLEGKQRQHITSMTEVFFLHRI